jgi:hypothetical protein
MEPKQQLDIRKTTPVLTSTGSKIWVEGFILRKASRFLTGGINDSIIPVPIFYCPTTMEINREGLPKEMDFLLDEIQIDEPY